MEPVGEGQALPLRRLRSLCVFCGSSPGFRPAYVDEARSLGRTLAERETTVVYGGGSTGLMGAVADAALAAGGRVVGVIPRWLARVELMHMGLSETHIVDSLQERKAMMSQLAEGFLALPGGFGTLDELLEVITWTQLALETKPIGLLNVEGFYEPLLTAIDRTIAEGFIRPQFRKLFVVSSRVPEVLDAMGAYELPSGADGLRPLLPGEP